MSMKLATARSATPTIVKMYVPIPPVEGRPTVEVFPSSHTAIPAGFAGVGLVTLSTLPASCLQTYAAVTTALMNITMNQKLRR